MKNKKGFTLVELLAVIALLSVIVTLAATSAISISKKLKDDMYCQQVDFISTAAKTYGSDIIDRLDETGITVKVKDLVDKGYLKKDQDVPGSYILDSRDGSSMDEVEVRIYLKNHRAYAHVDVDTSSCEE